MEKGLVHPELLVTDQMSLRNISTAFEKVERQDPSTLKVVLDVGDCGPAEGQ